LSFLSELRRRNVFRVAATYIIASWLIIQVVTSISGPLNFPEWFEAAVIVLLIIGFTIAIVLAWAFELTPEGIKVTPSNAAVSGAKSWNLLDTTLVIALFAVAAAMVWSRLGVDGTAPGERSSQSPGKSVAVLPFVDMSQAGDQVFFGDGIAEEVLNELTRLEGLRVASRTSSFAYRDGEADTREIARALNVSTVLEGSVRKSGERIRVTAQLINAADGYHLWSEVFERQLTDVFAIQDEIAQAVAGALGVRMGVGDVNAFGGAGTTNVEAYEAYLRGMNTPLFPAAQSDERIRLFERAVELDPDYAAAWAALGLTIGSTMWISSVDDAPAILDRAIPVLQRAIALGPDSLFAYTMLATVNYAGFDWIASEQYYLKAMEIQPDGHTFDNYANMLMRSGRSSDSLRYKNRAHLAERNPSNPTGMMAWTYAATGQLEKLHEMADALAGPGGLPFSLITALNTGDSELLQHQLRSLPADTAVAGMLKDSILGNIDSPDKVLEILRSVYTDRDTVWPSKYQDIALFAAFFGDHELALESISYEARRTTVRYGALWFPVMSEVRKLPGFKQLVTDVNLVEYWRKFGWADHCRPVGGGDFECF
jgi:TolB-like protein/uncharacterized membrane protein YhdT